MPKGQQGNSPARDLQLFPPQPLLPNQVETSAVHRCCLHRIIIPITNVCARCNCSHLRNGVFAMETSKGDYLLNSSRMLVQLNWNYYSWGSPAMPPPFRFSRLAASFLASLPPSPQPLGPSALPLPPLLHPKPAGGGRVCLSTLKQPHWPPSLLGKVPKPSNNPTPFCLSLSPSPDTLEMTLVSQIRGTPPHPQLSPAATPLTRGPPGPPPGQMLSTRLGNYNQVDRHQGTPSIKQIALITFQTLLRKLPLYTALNGE